MGEADVTSLLDGNYKPSEKRRTIEPISIKKVTGRGAKHRVQPSPAHTMRLILSNFLVGCWLASPAAGFSSTAPVVGHQKTIVSSSTQLHSTIGLGLGQRLEQEGNETAEGGEEEKKELVAGVDYEIPDHESYRTSRRSKLDEQCDAWFGALLGGEDDKGVLGKLADDAREILLTPVPLVNEVCLDRSWSILTRLSVDFSSC